MTGMLEPPDHPELDTLDWMLKLHRDHGDTWLITKMGDEWRAVAIANSAVVLRAMTAAELNESTGSRRRRVALRHDQPCRTAEGPTRRGTRQPGSRQPSNWRRQSPGSWSRAVRSCRRSARMIRPDSAEDPRHP
jgi:hypothetical protein